MPLSIMIKLNKAAVEVAPVAGLSVDGQRQQQMWNILRGPQGRTPMAARDLALLASTADIPVSGRQAARYLQALTVRSLVRRATASTYWLPRGRITGPLAPCLMVAQLLFDPNTRSIAKGPYEAVETPL